MLGVFLLPAFTLLGHECQDLLSPCDGMRVCTDWTSVYTVIRKSLRERGQNLCELQGEKSPLPEGSEEGQTRDAASRRIASPTHDQLSCSGPLRAYGLCRMSNGGKKRGHRGDTGYETSLTLRLAKSLYKSVLGCVLPLQEVALRQT